MDATKQHDLAVCWNLAARAMIAAGEDVRSARQAASGLYAQGILGLSEEDCRVAKTAEALGDRTLVDCLSMLAHLDRETSQKVMAGLMMLAYSDGHMTALEVRWASMAAAAFGLEPDDFQKCAVNARVVATMLAPRHDNKEGES
jgi:uncharacterized tellurite resistance protein B-like protein